MYQLFFRARERPHMIMDENGELAALATSVGNPGPQPGERDGGNGGAVGRDHTFTLIQPIANARHHPPP
jgi:hypothetical protein